MLNKEFRLSQHSTGNWKSVISIGMSDGGHKSLSLQLVRQSVQTRPNINKGPSVNKRGLWGVSFSGFSELPLIHFIIPVKCFC